MSLLHKLITGFVIASKQALSRASCSPKPWRRRRQSILGLLILFLSSYINITYALDTDRDQPLTVNSASMDVDLKNHTTVYRGNVVAVQGSTTLTADTLTLYADKNNKLEKAVAEGNPATYQTLPSPDKAIFHAEATTIEYHLKEQLIILIKHAKLIQAEHSYLGPRLIYNIKNETVTSPPSTEGRATIIMNPKAKTP